MISLQLILFLIDLFGLILACCVYWKGSLVY